MEATLNIKSRCVGAGVVCAWARIIRFDPENTFESSRATYELSGRCECNHLQQVKCSLAGSNSAAKKPKLSAAWKLHPRNRYSEVSNQNPPPGPGRFLGELGDSMRSSCCVSSRGAWCGPSWRPVPIRTTSRKVPRA